MKKHILLFSLIIIPLCVNASATSQTKLKPAKLIKPPKIYRAPKYMRHKPTVVYLNTPAHKKNLKGELATRDANSRSTLSAQSNQYINSTMNFTYESGALYQIYCAPLAVTDIVFESGEHIISIAAGDTLRWQVSKTYSGEGRNQSQHILIKPADVDLTNTMVIMTSRRTYHLVLNSTEKTYMASVQWEYPNQDGSFIKKYNHQPPVSRNQKISNQLDLAHMNFDYQTELVRGRVPDWMPTAVFNDGHKTYIQFPKSTQQAPTLYINKNDEIVNYRVTGNYYIIDELISYAELASGHKNSSVVRITTKQ